MPITALFLDGGGVLLDPSTASAQWRRSIGEYLAPRLGGEPEAWAAANAYAAERMFARYRDPKGTPRETHPRLQRLWLREMCEHAGVTPPGNVGAFADELTRWVCERVGIPAPGAVEGVRALKRIGLRLFTASGHRRVEIDGYLTAVGIRDLFEEVYGNDVIDRWKTNAGFYRKVLEHSGVLAEQAAVVDDQERFLDYAKRAGFARCFLLAPPGTSTKHEVIGALVDLVPLLSR